VTTMVWRQAKRTVGQTGLVEIGRQASVGLTIVRLNRTFVVSEQV
jgi:hypothetical protein